MSDAKALAAEFAALVDLLVPGDGELPAASEVGVQAKLADRLLVVRGDGAVAELIQALAACGGPLAPLDEDGGRAVLARLERELPDYFLRCATSSTSPTTRARRCTGDPAPGLCLQRDPAAQGLSVGRFDPATDLPRHQRGHFVPTERSAARRPLAARFPGRRSWLSLRKKPADVLIIGSGASGAIASHGAGRGRAAGGLPRAGRLDRARRPSAHEPATGSGSGSTRWIRTSMSAGAATTSRSRATAPSPDVERRSAARPTSTARCGRATGHRTSARASSTGSRPTGRSPTRTSPPTTTGPTGSSA